MSIVSPEIITIVATGAGYAGGQVAEHIARSKIDENREAILGAAHDGAVDESLAKNSWLRRTTAQLAIIGALTGFSASQALQPEGDSGTPSVAGVAIDNPYVAAKDGGAKRAVAIANELTNTNEVDIQAVVAHNGDYGPIKLSELSKDRSYGPSSIDTATTATMNSVFNTVRSDEAGSDENIDAGVLIVTNGNPIGKVETVVAKAKQSGDMPVYIANVADQNRKIDTDLKAIADKTGGKYWDIDTDPQDIANGVEKGIDKQSPDQKQAPKERLPWVIVSIGLLGLGVRKFKDRSEETAIS